MDENDVLVDEWERFPGVPSDQRAGFLATHGDLFTLPWWDAVRTRVMTGELHYVLPYPPPAAYFGDTLENRQNRRELEGGLQPARHFSAASLWPAARG